jgi:cell division protein FtsN
MADMSRVNEYLGGFRLKVLSALSFKKPVSMVTKEISKGPEVSKPYLKEKTEQPEKSAAEVIPMEKKEEVVKKEEVTQEEKVAQNEKAISGEEVPKKEEVTRKENWVVHVASVKTIEQAMIHKERLMAAGFPAYSIRTKVRGEDWIRVRVGFFNNREEAQKAGNEVEKKLIAKEPYWITKVSKKEMEDLLGK